MSVKLSADHAEAAADTGTLYHSYTLLCAFDYHQLLCQQLMSPLQQPWHRCIPHQVAVLEDVEQDDNRGNVQMAGPMYQVMRTKES